MLFLKIKNNKNLSEINKKEPIMKNLDTLIQNAIEDHIVSLDKDPTIEDIKRICTFDISSVVWKALREATQRRNKIATEPTINGVKQSNAKYYLNELAKQILGKPVGSVINTIKVLFKTANTYGFKFFYCTNEGVCDYLKHSRDDSEPIVGVGIEKIKK